MCNSRDNSFDLQAAWEDIISTCSYNSTQQRSETVTTFGGLTLDGDFPYAGLVLAPGGYIYGVPYRASKIIKIDTNTDSVTFISLDGLSTNHGQFSGGAYAPNGCIYMMMCIGNKILKLDPSDDTYTYIDGAITDTSTYKYTTACCTKKGVIYAFPAAGGSGKIIKLNTKTDTYTLLNDYTFNGQSGGYFGCSTLAHDGYIYAFTRSGLNTIRLNPVDDTITQYATYTSYGGYKHEGSANGIDGNVYCFPSNNSTDLVVADTTQNTVTKTATGYYASDAILAPNGYIYGMPRSTTSPLLVNSQNGSYSTVNLSYSGYTWGRLAPNGCIYAVPLEGGNNKSILKIQINTDRNFKESTLLSPYMNNY